MSLYNGLSTTIQNLKLKKDFLIGVENGTNLECSAIPEGGPTHGTGGPTQYALGEFGAEVLTSAFPDLSANYTYSGTVACPDSPSLAVCQLWHKTSDIMGKVGNYNFYSVATETGAPYRFEFYGHDDLFGSHYDHYIFNYESFNTDVDEYAFSPPPMCSEPSDLKSDQRLMGGMQKLFQAKSTHEFHDFMAAHGKGYDNHEEYNGRMSNYHTNAAYINAHNAKDESSFTMRVNHMADWSDDEFKIRRGVRRPEHPISKPNYTYHLGDYHKSLEHLGVYMALPHVQDATLRGRNSTAAPDNWDWRAKGVVTPVKDQAVCGSCWTFGSTGALEGALAIQKGIRTELSQQFLVDCAWFDGNAGCGGGTAEGAYTWLAKQGGIPTADSYGPYLGVNNYCKIPSTFSNIAQVSGYSKVAEGDESAFKEALYVMGPHYVAVDASHKSFGFYHEGIYSDPNCASDPDDLDHAILAVGYGTDSTTNQDYWIVKNSWSTYWGQQGYIHMARNKGNMCGIASDAVHPKLV